MRTASAATTRSAVITRCALTRDPSVSRVLSRSVPAPIRSSRAITAAERASSALDSRRCRGQARSRYRANVAGSVSIRIASAVDAQSTTTRSHCPESASSPTSCRPEHLLNSGQAPKVLLAQYLPGQTRGICSESGPAISRHRVASSARVSSASASRNPPPERRGVEVGQHPGRLTPAGGRDGRTEHVAGRVRLVGGHDQHPHPGARIAHGGRGRQRRLTHAALADEQTDPGSPGARAASAAWLRSVSLDSFLQVLQRGVGQPRSALRFSRPIIGMTRSTDSS